MKFYLAFPASKQRATKLFDGCMHVQICWFGLFEIELNLHFKLDF
jgi:hypothetical protein